MSTFLIFTKAVTPYTDHLSIKFAMCKEHDGYMVNVNVRMYKDGTITSHMYTDDGLIDGSCEITDYPSLRKLAVQNYTVWTGAGCPV